MLIKNGTLKNLLTISLLFILLFAAAGCSQNNAGQNNAAPTTKENGVIDPGNPQVDEDVSARLQKEKNVELGQVIIREDVVSANIIAKEGVSKKDLDRLAEEYGSLLDKKYPDKKIRVQVVQSGESIVDKRWD